LVCVKALGRAMCAASCLLLAACGTEPASPEQQVRALIESVQQSIEEGSVRQVGDLLHEGYSDPRHANRYAAVRTLFGITQRHRGVHLFTVIKTIDLTAQQDSADAVVYVAMTGVPVESMQALVSLKADLYRFDLGLVEERGEWLVLSARWERMDSSLL